MCADTFVPEFKGDGVINQRNFATKKRCNVLRGATHRGDEHNIKVAVNSISLNETKQDILSPLSRV